MNPVSQHQNTLSLYATAWHHTGPGVFVAMMYVIVASAGLLSDQTSAVGLPDPAEREGMMRHEMLSHLIPDTDSAVSHSVRLQIPLAQLRAAHGNITPNGESFFLLLARRMKSQSLNLVLAADSPVNAEFAATISAMMMKRVELEATQIRIRLNSPAREIHNLPEPRLILTITRQEFAGDTSHETDPFNVHPADDDDDFERTDDPRGDNPNVEFSGAGPIRAVHSDGFRGIPNRIRNGPE